MRLAILLLVLMSVVAQKPVPPIVVIPPRPPAHLGWRQWNAYIPTPDEVAPDDESLGSLMSRHPAKAFEAIHDLDEEVCTNGPSDEVTYPNRNRCEGLI